MKPNYSSNEFILDIGSMKTFALRLIGKGKPYEPVLLEIIEADYFYDDEKPLPTLKELSKKLNIKYDLKNLCTWFWD